LVLSNYTSWPVELQSIRKWRKVAQSQLSNPNLCFLGTNLNDSPFPRPFHFSHIIRRTNIDFEHHDSQPYSPTSLPNEKPRLYNPSSHYVLLLMQHFEFNFSADHCEELGLDRTRHSGGGTDLSGLGPDGIRFRRRRIGALWRIPRSSNAASRDCPGLSRIIAKWYLLTWLCHSSVSQCRRSDSKGVFSCPCRRDIDGSCNNSDWHLSFAGTCGSGRAKDSWDEYLEGRQGIQLTIFALRNDHLSKVILGLNLGLQGDDL
jgi:hypothetical protein